MAQSLAVPGPVVKLDQPLPCGCHVAREPDGRLRLWYCRTHAAAFHMLDALRASLDALDQVIRHPGNLDALGRAQAAAREAIHKTKPPASGT